MIDASFSSTGRDATVSGAYQYDTGQRLRMHGLPSPSELAERDSLLGGDGITVQAQFSFTGDSQTEMRLAAWEQETEDEPGVWVAEIPDVYLQRNAEVHVYVYVSYGQTETSMRSKTVYEAVFRPISRPAPSTNVTPDQTNAWDKLVGEINAATSDAYEKAGLAAGATETAELAAAAANTAADAATEAVKSANNALDVYVTMVDSMQVEATRLGAYAEPTVEIKDVTNDETGKKHKLITFGFPQSVVTVNKIAADDNGDITLTPEDVGADIKEFYVELPERAEWIGYSDSPFTTCDLTATGVEETDKPVIDINWAALSNMTEDVVNNVIESWAKVVRVQTAKDKIVLSCLPSEICTAPLPLRILCVR